MDKLEELKKKVEEALAKKQFGDAFQVALKQLIELVKGTQQVLSTSQKNEFERIESSLESALQAFRSETQAGLSDTSKKQEERINNALFTIESLVSEAQSKIDEVRDGEDGMDADEEAIVGKVLELIPPPPVQTAEVTRDLLETLSGPERLKIEAIDKLREELDRLEKEIRKDRTVIGGSRGVGILDEGVTVDPNAHWLNFTGAGVSISTVGNQTVISITGGGAGSSTPAQESGTIADLTTIVTLGNTPVADTLMLYINEAFVDPSRYTVNGSDAIVMNSALDGSYTGLRYTAIYQY